MSNTFSAAIGAWAAKSEKRIEKVYQRSVELLGEEMAKTKPQGGRVPFLTGNLARSLLASTESMPKTSEKPTAGSNIGLIAATLKPQTAIYLGYQAVYARRMNYGFVGADVIGRVYSQQGNYFLEGAIAKWPEIVNQAVNEVRGR